MVSPRRLARMRHAAASEGRGRVRDRRRLRRPAGALRGVRGRLHAKSPAGWGAGGRREETGRKRRPASGQLAVQVTVGKGDGTLPLTSNSASYEEPAAIAPSELVLVAVTEAPVWVNLMSHGSLMV